MYCTSNAVFNFRKLRNNGYAALSFFGSDHDGTCSHIVAGLDADPTVNDAVLFIQEILAPAWW